MQRLTRVALLVVLAGCAKAPSPGEPPPPATGAPSPGLHWVRSSAEYRAIAIEVYRAATTAVEAASRDLVPGRWGVILDADETVLDNSEYQRRLERAGARFSDSTWTSWVREQAAGTVPGAVGFIARVRELGGRVAIVTNRAEKVCPETRANLAAVGVVADAVLCQPPGEGDKNPRFQRVADGTAADGVPPLEVLAWIGDNIQDFPLMRQTMRDDPASFEPFGRRFFVLPNPLYGSWERNPPRD